MATITQEAVRFGYTLSGNSPEVIYIPEGPSQTFKAGAPLFLTASGSVRIMPMNSGTAFDTVRKQYVGTALAVGTNHTVSLPLQSTNTIPVLIDNGDTIFLGNICNRLVAAQGTISLKEMGVAGGMSLNSSRLFFDKGAAATASLLRCRGIISAKGDLFGKVLFQALDTARVFRL